MPAYRSKLFRPPATPVDLIWHASCYIERHHWAQETPGGLTLSRALDRAVDYDADAPLTEEYQARINAAKRILAETLAAPYDGNLQAWEEATGPNRLNLTETEVAAQMRLAATHAVAAALVTS